MAVAPYLTPDRTAADAALDRLMAAVRPHAAGTSFLTLLTDPARTRTAFTPANWTRLTEVKRAWDPDRVFRLGHSIPPAGKASS
ncbi:BBE domain-containing protein [Dactylosporangium matsuzakiense]|uniref:Berberine/berberine-like domain-containing protein n=1 Tax=Dactylosporangium matsuzakiense TaxID=53360 RepID=A0A9W6KUZ1_9ACTN|nr:BBE domain-containing protein [Dactylosporangium matsuzakiense]UWZ41452.1 BBE domain-containing protein [Dactylosporangium matsuzakiense]GLL07011.1 hypothetical protein GCM10017581_087620 [Dactylosporangium matsuzakiense]